MSVDNEVRMRRIAVLPVMEALFKNQAMFLRSWQVILEKAVCVGIV